LGISRFGENRCRIALIWMEMAGLVETRCRNAPNLRHYDSIIAVLVNTYNKNIK
jgi:hypothetical protein